MQITSLDQMESIVANNKSLSWDGWTVLHTKQDTTAWSKTNGVFKNSLWHVQNRYEPIENGWNLPLKLAS
jgi:hypothetical protein